VEELCPNCPLWALLGDQASRTVSSVRMHPRGKEDGPRIRALDCGKAAIEALRQPRPERCEALRKILPKPQPDTKHIHSYARCPEIGLIAEVLANFEPGSLDVIAGPAEGVENIN
jgi:hypothetical protein